MRSVYSVQLVDKVFLHYSEEVLANMAQDYLDVFKSANDKFFSAHLDLNVINGTPGGQASFGRCFLVKPAVFNASLNVAGTSRALMV